MRRSYEFKQESYVVEADNTPWKNYHTVPTYKSFYVPPPPPPPPPPSHNIHRKSSFDHHYDPSDDHHDDHDQTVFNESIRAYHGDDIYVDHDVKRNEHHAMGSKTILRPPLRSANLPTHHNRATFVDGSQKVANHDAWRYNNNGTHQKVVNHDAWGYNNNGAQEGYNGNYGEVARYEEYDKGRMMHGELESLVKRIESGGRKVDKIEVIEYETRRYVPGAYYEWREYGVRPATNNGKAFVSSHPKSSP